MRRGLIVLAALAAALVATATVTAAPSPRVQVVVELESPSLARARVASKALRRAEKTARVDMRAPSTAGYLRELAAEQRAVEARIRRTVPAARVRWRYGVVANALAIVVPRAAVARLVSVDGVRRVHRSVGYRARLDRTPRQIGVTPEFLGPNRSLAGNGLKIGVIDDGLDQTHPFFSPAGYAMPAGFPKGDAAYTTAKVVAARAFPPPGATYVHASKPFDPLESGHGTHVAGIAAGNFGTPAGNGTTVSGVAPAAYLGNYKVLTIPTASDVGLDGNSPEIVAGIEAAVRDGMDVINLSLGEPEIEPSSDIVARALDAAMDAGVVVSVAAGNDFSDFGRGSLSSPGSAAKAITVGAVTSTTSGTGTMASFSASGPTPLSLRLKPDVVAPGTDVLSSVPGGWDAFSGTSMAAPHVAGAAALLRQRHPTWTPAQVKAALVATGRSVAASGAGETLPTRAGGGLVDVPRANTPLLFAAPPTLSFGLLRPRATASRDVVLSDAGGGAGAWTATVTRLDALAGVTVTIPGTVTVPGTFSVRATIAPAARDGEASGFVVLTRGGERRRIPFWLRADTVDRRSPDGTLRRTGTYRGNSAGKRSAYGRYLYPERVAGRVNLLAGPEQVFRVRIPRRVANFGVAVVSEARGVNVTPRIIVAGEPSRMVGYTSLELNLNPYLRDFQAPRSVAGAILPLPGLYDIVFDTRSRRSAGRYTFRFWINDTAPPTIALRTRSVRRGNTIVVLVRDRGAGVDPRSVTVSLDGNPIRVALRNGRLVIPTRTIARGRHRLVLQASDYQETRNMENVPRILPNTRRVQFSVVVR